MELPARTLIFSFGSGATFGPGRGTAGGRSVTQCQGVFLIRRVSCGLVSAPGTVKLPARSLIFSFGSSGSLSVPWNSGIACQNLDFFIRFRSDVWPGEGRQCCSVTPCQGVFLTPARTLIFSFGSGVTFGPGRGTAGGCSVTPRQGVFLTRRVLACSPRLEQWNCLPEP